jgi:hypothetical protein
MREWHHYQEWEDWRAGMYGALPGSADDAARLLGNPDLFGEAARAMVNAWPVAAAQHLSDTSCNRRAWVGQASCCYAFQCSRLTTIEGWFTLPVAVQAAANAVAEEVIVEWEGGRRRAQTLFG